MPTVNVNATYLGDDGQQYTVTGTLTALPAEQGGTPAEQGAAATDPATDPAAAGVDPNAAAGDPGTGGVQPTDPAAGDTPSAVDPGADPAAPTDPTAGDSTAGDPTAGDPTAGDLGGEGVDPTTTGADAGTDTTGTDGGPANGGQAPAAPDDDSFRELSRDDAQQTPDDAVRDLQGLLADRGIDCGPIDGYFGPRTENGVRLFQMNNGLPATGVADEATVNALNAAA